MMLTSNEREEFLLAMQAFDLFTLAERERALDRFAQLRYPSVTARFFEAVHSVIAARDQGERKK